MDIHFEDALPEPGSVALNSHAIRMAISLLARDDLDKYEKKKYAFSSLMQLVESIVLHENIFIPVYFGFVTTYPTFSEERTADTYNYNLDELAHKSVFGDEMGFQNSGLAVY